MRNIKKFEDFLDRMQGLLDNAKEQGHLIVRVEDLENTFPELKETEDERIRKELISFLQLPHPQFVGKKRNQEKWLAWLEKQGEQKPTDKVEPKFKVGDWVVREYTKDIITINQVVDFKRIDDEHFGYTLDDETYFSGSWENSYHLWTIQDAKDGDVIYLPNGNNEYYFFIFKGIENAAVKSFAHFYQYNDGTSKVEGTIDKLSSVNDVFQPATKEQRDLLFQKMKEAGYEWDAEKKELKKIESDLTEFENVLADVCRGWIGEELRWKDYIIKNSLPLLELAKKQFDKYEQKPVWGEDDGHMLDETIQHLEELIRIDKVKHCACDVQYYQRDIDWLKAIKLRMNNY